MVLPGPAVCHPGTWLAFSSVRKYCRAFRLNGADGFSPPTCGDLCTAWGCDGLTLLQLPHRIYCLFLERRDRNWRNAASAASAMALLGFCRRPAWRRPHAWDPAGRQALQRLEGWAERGWQRAAFCGLPVAQSRSVPELLLFKGCALAANRLCGPSAGRQFPCRHLAAPSALSPGQQMTCSHPVRCDMQSVNCNFPSS